MRHIYSATIALAMVAASAQAQMPTARHIDAPARVAAESVEAITEVEGTPTYYRRTSLGWYIYAGGNNLQYGEIPGTSKIIWSSEDDNVAYIYNPLTADARNTYIKCTVDGDKLRADFPQVLAILDDATGQGLPLYIGKLVPFEDEAGQSYMPIEDQQANYYTWTMQPDGTVTLDHDPVSLNANGDFTNGIPKDILGTYYYQDGIDGKPEAFWNGVGDWAQTYNVVEVEPITPMPGDVTIESWQMTSKKTTRMVNVAIDGDKLYMTRLTPYGDGALVGSIEGSEVVFPSLQNLGFSFKYNANVYFIATIAVYGSYDFGDFVMTFLDHFDWQKEMRFVYDPNAKTLTPAVEDQCILINGFKESVSLYEYIEMPSFAYLPPEGMDAAPENPVIVVPGRYEGIEDGYYLEFILPVKNVNGVTLNTDKMYYNIYLNDELTTFYTDQYRYLEDDVTDIPYNLSDRNHDFTVQGETHMLQLHSEGINTIGIQSCFVGDDGTVYRSDLVTCETSTGIALPNADLTVESEQYYDMQGRRITDAGTGICVKRVKYSDGSVKTIKIVK